MGNASCMQANCNKDGETFMNCFAVGLVLLGEHPFLVGVQSALPDVVNKAETAQITQEQHATIEQIRVLLEQGVSTETMGEMKRKDNFVLPRRRAVSGAEAFFAGCLSDRVILANDRRTVMRREPWEIPRGCVVISEEPLRRSSQGLFFAIRLEGVLKEGWNSSWPMMGMTQMTPSAVERDGYPMKAEWFGKSVCIGGEFQAWVREKPVHFKQRFGKAKPEELSSFDGPRPRFQNRNTTPWELAEGDVMGMLYTPNGMVHLMLNYQTVLSVDTGKPLESGDYYAVVDCQGQAYEITRLPYSTPVAACSHELGLQPKISHKVFDYVSKSAASKAISSCTFSVTIADPSQPDIPLVAVSPGFEQMTGYSCAEIVGLNCRFLNYDCAMDIEQRSHIREICRTGEPYTCMLRNRRKSGEEFLNLLDLRGLRVAKDTETGEDIWYLIGIQSDISELVDEDGEGKAAIQEAHERELQRITEHLRNELQQEFAQFVVTSTLPALMGAHASSGSTVAKKVEGDEYDEDAVVFMAAPDIERGPKPDMWPNVALLEPDWISEREPEEPEPERSPEGSLAKTIVHRMIQGEWQGRCSSLACSWQTSRAYSSGFFGVLFASIGFAVVARLHLHRNRFLLC